MYNLTISNINIQGLNQSKLDAISFSEAYETDVICLTETHLQEQTDVSYLNIEGYHPIIRRDRIDQMGGGVAIFVSSHLTYKIIKILTDPVDLEILWINLQFNKNKIILGVCYRPPKSLVSFWDKLHDSVSCIKTQYTMGYGIVLCGDFNADLETLEGSRLERFASANLFTLHVSQPTRITETSSSCLDQILSNIPDKISNVDISAPVSTNDHCTVTIKLRYQCERQYSYQRHVWLYKLADFKAFRHALKQADWDSCFQYKTDVNVIYERWNKLFMQIAHEHIPNRKVTVRLGDKPWYSNELRLLKRRKNRIHKKAKFNNSPIHWHQFRIARNEYCQKLKAAEKQYYINLCDAVETNTFSNKSFWQTAKRFLGNNSDCTIPTLSHNDESVTSTKAKVECFNHYFTSKCSLDETGATLPPQLTHNTPVLCDIYISETQVSDILKSLSPNKAAGPDGIGPKLIKEVGDAIVPSLTRLFNLSLESHTVPLEWKNANVIPIHKKGPKNLVQNYRPISLLSILSKCFEKIIFQVLFNFLIQHKLLSNWQSGFTPGDSTINQLVSMYHIFAEALDNKKDVRLVFCDVTAAFDRVWHTGLLHKLYNIGIRGNLLLWFEDYLSNRTQRVVLQGVSSSWGNINAGVPQGSVLGPLLFLIYINDLPKVVESSVRLFADDTTLFVIVDDIEEATLTQNGDLYALKLWADQWLVSFNPKKNQKPLYFK